MSGGFSLADSLSSLLQGPSHRPPTLTSKSADAQHLVHLQTTNSSLCVFSPPIRSSDFRVGAQCEYDTGSKVNVLTWMAK